MSVGVCYTGPFMDASGYGEATRNAVRALYVAGANIKTEKVSFTGAVHYDGENTHIAQELSERGVDYAIKILHVTPDIYKNYIEKGKYHIGHLFWETNKLPVNWVQGCNLLNEIWTGTKYNAEVIRNSGVTVPIYIFPQAIETVLPDDIRPFKLPGVDENTLVFYSIFEWNERKNPRKLLEAYWKAFKDVSNTVLLLKVHKGSYNEAAVTAIIEEAKRWRDTMGFKDTPRVLLCTNLLSQEEKHRLHETGDVYVSAHRGEGWGLPQAEAALHKKPIISTKYGGIHEYWSANHYYSVDYDLVPIDKVYNKYYSPDMCWAEANEEQLIERMLFVHTQWKEGKMHKSGVLKAGGAKSIVTRLFNYDVVGAQMLARLKEIEAR